MKARIWNAFVIAVGTLGFALVLGGALTGPSDVEAARATEAAAEDAAALASREWVISQHLCGPNGSARWVSDKEVRCPMHSGKLSGSVVVAGGRP